MFSLWIEGGNSNLIYNRSVAWIRKKPIYAVSFLRKWPLVLSGGNQVLCSHAYGILSVDKNAKTVRLRNAAMMPFFRSPLRSSGPASMDLMLWMCQKQSKLVIWKSKDFSCWRSSSAIFAAAKRRLILDLWSEWTFLMRVTARVMMNFCLTTRSVSWKAIYRPARSRRSFLIRNFSKVQSLKQRLFYIISLYL